MKRSMQGEDLSSGSVVIFGVQQEPVSASLIIIEPPTAVSLRRLMKIFIHQRMVETIMSFKKTVQINSKVTQIMTPTVNVNEHTTYTNLLHILHNRLSEA